MAKSGDRIDNPLTGEYIIWRTTAEESKGAELVYDQFVPAGGAFNGEHIHLNFQEKFEIISGTGTYRLGGVTQKTTIGQVIVAPPKTRHQNPYNLDKDELHLIITVTPEMGTQTYFETLYGLARDGKLNAHHEMKFWQLVVVANDLKGRTAFIQAPVWLQVWFLPIFSFIGHLMGYQARYDKYSGPAAK